MTKRVGLVGSETWGVRGGPCRARGPLGVWMVGGLGLVWGSLGRGALRQQVFVRPQGSTLTIDQHVNSGSDCSAVSRECQPGCWVWAGLYVREVGQVQEEWGAQRHTAELPAEYVGSRWAPAHQPSPSPEEPELWMVTCSS